MNATEKTEQEARENKNTKGAAIERAKRWFSEAQDIRTIDDAYDYAMRLYNRKTRYGLRSQVAKILNNCQQARHTGKPYIIASGQWPDAVYLPGYMPLFGSTKKMVYGFCIFF